MTFTFSLPYFASSWPFLSGVFATLILSLSAGALCRVSLSGFATARLSGVLFTCSLTTIAAASAAVCSILVRFLDVPTELRARQAVTLHFPIHAQDVEKLSII